MESTDVLLKSDEQVSSLEIMWLNTRGGRIVEDVRLDQEKRKYVSMYHPDTENGEAVVYLPTRQELINFFNPSVDNLVEQTVDNLGD